MSRKRLDKRSAARHHTLGFTAIAILVSWTVLYRFSDPSSHWGSFFGNAIADWSGVVVMIFATKFLYEKGSSESRSPKPASLPPALERLRDHSLTIFLAITGVAWLAIYIKADPQGKWGQVVGNILSEWVQITGLVLLTKRLIEWHSKESKG